MNIRIFGSRSLTAVHLPAMIAHLRRLAGLCSPEEPLVLWHGDGPPGKAPGAIGADRLAEVAALISWEGRHRKLRRFRVQQAEGEEWGEAALRRNRQLVAAGPAHNLCFHTDPGMGRGSAHTARLLKETGQSFLFVLLAADGRILKEEER